MQEHALPETESQFFFLREPHLCESDRVNLNHINDMLQKVVYPFEYMTIGKCHAIHKYDKTNNRLHQRL